MKKTPTFCVRDGWFTRASEREGTNRPGRWHEIQGCGTIEPSSSWFQFDSYRRPLPRHASREQNHLPPPAEPLSTGQILARTQPTHHPRKLCIVNRSGMRKGNNKKRMNKKRFPLYTSSFAPCWWISHDSPSSHERALCMWKRESENNSTPSSTNVSSRGWRRSNVRRHEAETNVARPIVKRQFENLSFQRFLNCFVSCRARFTEMNFDTYLRSTVDRHR